MSSGADHSSASDQSSRSSVSGDSDDEDSIEDDDLDEKPERMKDVDYWTMEANVHQDSLSIPRKSTSSPDKLQLANITPSNE